MKCNDIATFIDYRSIWSAETRTRIGVEMYKAVKNRKKSHTQQEIAAMFDVSRRKVIDFENGKFDFNLYDQYKALFLFIE